MKIVDTTSAVESVAAENHPSWVVTIRLRRIPQLPAGEVIALLRGVPNVRKVRERRLGGYWVDPESDITEQQWNNLVQNLYRVALRIT